MKASGNVFTMFNNMQPSMVSTTYTGTLADKNVYGFVTRDAATQKVAVIMWNNTSSTNTMSLTVNNLPYVASSRNIKVTRYDMNEHLSNYKNDAAYAAIKGYSTTPSEGLNRTESSIVASATTFSRPGISLEPYSMVQFILEPTTSAPTAGPVDADPALPKPNLAAGRTVTASSSVENWGWFRSRAVDEYRYSMNTVDTAGAESLGWSSNPGYPTNAHTEWLQVDLGASRTINQIKLYPRSDVGNAGKGFPVDFKLQGWNGSVWTDLYSATNYNSGVAPTTVQTFNVTSGSYSAIRLYVTKLGAAGGEYRAQIAELEVYNTAAYPAPVNNGTYEILDKLTKHELHMTGNVYSGIAGVYYTAVTPPAWQQTAQRWTLQDVGGGYWKLVSVANPANVLHCTGDLYNGQAGYYRVVAGLASWNTDNQRWQIVDAGDGYVKLRNKMYPTVVLQSSNSIYSGTPNVYEVFASPESLNLSSQKWFLAQQ